MPETVYSGLKDGASRHSHEELSVALKAYTDAVIGNPSKRLSASWIDGLNGILDAYLGPCPEKFVYDGKEYTPKSFAQELGIRRDDYVVFTAMTHHPLYTAFPLEIPDNWNWSPFCNVTMEELGRIVDVSLRNGYAVKLERIRLSGGPCDRSGRVGGGNSCGGQRALERAYRRRDSETDAPENGRASRTPDHARNAATGFRSLRDDRRSRDAAGGDRGGPARPEILQSEKLLGRNGFV